MLPVCLYTNPYLHKKINHYNQTLVFKSKNGRFQMKYFWKPLLKEVSNKYELLTCEHELLKWLLFHHSVKVTFLNMAESTCEKIIQHSKHNQHYYTAIDILDDSLISLSGSSKGRMLNNCTFCSSCTSEISYTISYTYIHLPPS